MEQKIIDFLQNRLNELIDCVNTLGGDDFARNKWKELMAQKEMGEKLLGKNIYVGFKKENGKYLAYKVKAN
jgi:hypothetical protein